jgi:hypothetical protein
LSHFTPPSFLLSPSAFLLESAIAKIDACEWKITKNDHTFMKIENELAEYKRELFITKNHFHDADMKVVEANRLKSSVLAEPVKLDSNRPVLRLLRECTSSGCNQTPIHHSSIRAMVFGITNTWRWTRLSKHGPDTWICLDTGAAMSLSLHFG